MSPVSLLFKSRKFWLLVLDTIIMIIGYCVARWVPSAEGDIKFFIGVLQPVFVMLIVSIAYEDGKAKANGNFTGRF